MKKTLKPQNRREQHQGNGMQRVKNKKAKTHNVNTHGNLRVDGQCAIDVERAN